MSRKPGRPPAPHSGARTPLRADHETAWQDACRRYGPKPGDGGLRPATIEQRDKALRRFYAFLEKTGWVDPDAPLLDHITGETISAYAVSLADANRHNRHERVRHVYEVARMLDPAADLGDVDAVRRTLKFERGDDRPPRVSPDLPDRETALDVALQTIWLTSEPADATGFRALRDAVLLAVQTDAVLRHGELWQLEFDHTLVRFEERWLIALGGEHTKTRKRRYHTCHPDVSAALDCYRRHHAAFADTAALWIDPADGTAISYGHLGTQFERTCQRLLGRRYPVHVFRHAARGDYARDPNPAADAARAHLGHTDTRTGRYTYIHLKPLDVMEVQQIVCPL